MGTVRHYRGARPLLTPYSTCQEDRNWGPTVTSPHTFLNLIWNINTEFLRSGFIETRTVKGEVSGFWIEASSRGTGVACCCSVQRCPLSGAHTDLGRAVAEQKTIAQTSNPAHFPQDGNSVHGCGRDIWLHGGAFPAGLRTRLSPHPPMTNRCNVLRLQNSYVCSLEFSNKMYIFLAILENTARRK